MSIKERVLKAHLSSYAVLGLIFFLAVSFRTFLFFGVEKSLWLDEAALALNVINGSFLELFKPLFYAQSAPPLFLILTKVLVSVFGPGERVLRFIPFICSVLSTFVFYFLFKTVFYKENMTGKEKNKAHIVTLIALLSFSFAFPLLYNAIEFKPYSTDVLFTILTSLIWLKYSDSEITFKKQVKFGVLLSCFPLISFGSIFPVCAILILSLFKKIKLFSLVLASGLIFEYIFIFSKINQGTRVYDYWIPYFINFNPAKIPFILAEILKYYFYPSNFTLLCLIAFILGFIYLFLKNKKALGFFLLTIFLAFLASFFNFYPLYERLSLFLYPIIFIIVISPLYYAVFEKDGIKKAFIYLMSAIIIMSALLYNFSDKKSYKREEIKPLLLAIKREIHPGDRIFVFKGAHVTYRYYLKTAFKNSLGKFSSDTFVCPYDVSKEACATKIKPFCNVAPERKNSCYIIYSSEGGHFLRDIELLQKTVTELRGSLLLKDKNSFLYKLP